MSKPKSRSENLIEVAIEITNACNLNCQVCLNDKNSQIYLRFSKIKEVVDEAKSLGVEAIRITGGEPLLHKDIVKILEYIKSKGFYLISNTNGILLDDTLIKNLEKYLDSILVSIQGYNSSSEQRLTAGGCFFKERIKNLAKLASSKIDLIRAATIASNTLINNLDKYKLILTTLRIKNWVVTRPMLGKGDSFDQEYDISKKDILKLMDFMLSLQKTGISTNFGNALPFCISDDPKKISLLKSNSLTEGYKRIVYDIGEFYKPSYKINLNVGETIKQALKSPFLKKIRSRGYLPAKCQSCIYVKDCLGGSRYLAKKTSGSYFGHDPWMKK